MTVATLDLARASYRDISLYAPNRALAAIDLSDNTNLWGAPPAARRSITNATSSCFTRYPTSYAADLKRAIAGYVGVASDMIVTGCGSDDVLDSTFRAFGETGNVVAYPDPSFAMVPIFARMNGLECTPIPLTDSGDADAGRYVAVNAAISYLCSPNNPTGTAFSKAAIENVVSGVNGLVIVDEAYAEFNSWNCLSLLERFPRVVITRTLSKAFGLAGLRVGYAIGDPMIITEIEKSRGPYKVSSVAERAAIMALTEDRGWVEEHIREAVTIRGRLVDALTGIGLAPLPSASNFVLVPVAGAENLDRELRKRGIAVRPFTSLPRIGDALRISIGPWRMLERCVDVLASLIA